jgi:hypothetical protein
LAARRRITVSSAAEGARFRKLIVSDGVSSIGILPWREKQMGMHRPAGAILSVGGSTSFENGL